MIVAQVISILNIEKSYHCKRKYKITIYDGLFIYKGKQYQVYNIIQN